MDLGKAPEAGTIALIVVTAVISLLMGVFGKAAAEWVLSLILWPVRSVKEAVYRWIAPRNPLSISLRSYKRHVSRSNLTRIENPVGPNLDVPLEHAFAPLKLISGSTEESVELFTQAAASHRCIVLGGPGTGKTTLMKSLVTGVVKGRAREEALKDLIPVFVVLRNLAKKEHTVEQAVVAAFDDHHFPGADKFVESALSQGRMLVILDGLDEVGASRDFVSEQIQHFCEHDDQRPHRNRLIVTCRENSYRTKDLQAVIPEVVRVEPFANHHMRVFLEGWPAHKGRSAVKLYGLIQSDPQIRDICRNPLLLTILTGLYLDTDNFELPTSRERFYSDAVDELLVQRPARRQIKQTYDADDKRHILERVALERLETAARGEDPEEFTREAIARKAAEVLRREDFGPRELIREMVEINGIIKPASEGNYTCAHRTIQEYFAAREAGRTRETREVVEHFGGRPEFIEVLYFYCGLLGNIPALTSIVNTLVGQSRWLEAGRCMLHMKEPPARAQVQRVARELHALVRPSVEYKAALEVLSSLAQRRAPEFDPARDEFAGAVDELAGAYGESGAAALESALATSPEAAMKLIPGLLTHQSPRWREAAVSLLRDIGTDEALDQLVLLLNDQDPFIRERAARALADMLPGRQRDLRARAVLLPERRDSTVWPLEAYFPGRLAIPIAEPISDFPNTRSEAINCAARAVSARESATEEDRVFLRQWRRVPRDLTVRRYRRRLGMGLVLLSYSLALASMLVILAVQTWAYRAERVLVFTLSPPRVRTMESKWLYHVQRHAESAADAIWWSKGRWGHLTAEQEENRNTIARWADRLPDSYELADAPELVELRKVVPEYEWAGYELAMLENNIKALKEHLPPLQTANYIATKPELAHIMAFLVGFGVVIFSAFLLPAVLSPEVPLTLRARAKLFLASVVYGEQLVFYNFMFILIVSVFLSLSVRALDGSILFKTLPLLSFAGCVGVGSLLRHLDWPRNPLLDAVDDIIPDRNEDWGREEEPRDALLIH